MEKTPRTRWLSNRLPNDSQNEKSLQLKAQTSQAPEPKNSCTYMGNPLNCFILFLPSTYPIRVFQWTFLILEEVLPTANSLCMHDSNSHPSPSNSPTTPTSACYYKLLHSVPRAFQRSSPHPAITTIKPYQTVSSSSYFLSNNSLYTPLTYFWLYCVTIHTVMHPYAQPLWLLFSTKQIAQFQVLLCIGIHNWALLCINPPQMRWLGGYGITS